MFTLWEIQVFQIVLFSHLLHTLTVHTHTQNHIPFLSKETFFRKHIHNPLFNNLCDAYHTLYIFAHVAHFQCNTQTKIHTLYKRVCNTCHSHIYSFGIAQSLHSHSCILIQLYILYFVSFLHNKTLIDIMNTGFKFL